MSDDDEWDYQSNLATFTAVFQRKGVLFRTGIPRYTGEHQRNMQLMPAQRGGLREYTSSRMWNISTSGVARWLAKVMTHAQTGLQWKYTSRGRSG